MDVMSAVDYIQSQIMWEKNLVPWITEDRRESGCTTPAVARRGDDGPENPQSRRLVSCLRFESGTSLKQVRNMKPKRSSLTFQRYYSVMASLS